MNNDKIENTLTNSNSIQIEKENPIEKLLENQILIGGEDILKMQMKPIIDASSNENEKEKKAKTKFQEILKEMRIRIGTLLKTDNVSFLLGAGTSINAGGISIAKLPIEIEKSLLEKGIVNSKVKEWLNLFYQLVLGLGIDFAPSDLLERKKLLFDNNEKSVEIPINLEELLTNLITLKAAMNTDRIEICLKNDTTHVISKSNLEKLIKNLIGALIESCKLPKKDPQKDKESPIQHHRKMLKKVLTRPLNLKRVNIFTLNYDTLIEQAADSEGIVLVDGFVGALCKVFRPESFDQDFYFPAQTTEGHVHRLDRVIHLYKLHGSITWHRTEPNWENPYGLFASEAIKHAENDEVIIYPTPLKYGQALGLPYSELFRRFANAIVQPQSVLFVIGYGFGDEHVNMIIHQALAIPSFTLVIIDPAPQSKFVTKLIEQNDQRVWLISGWDIADFNKFVDLLLPDLREEEILKKIMDTYKAISITSPETLISNGE